MRAGFSDLYLVIGRRDEKMMMMSTLGRLLSARRLIVEGIVDLHRYDSLTTETQETPRPRPASPLDHHTMDHERTH